MVRRSGSGGPRKAGEPGGGADEVLRAKYIDYCSARLCDVFVELQEERVFELARLAEARAGVSQGVLSFQDLASLLVEQLLDDLALPDFESWSAEYQQHPEQYDPYLLGLWKTATGSPTPI